MSSFALLRNWLILLWSTIAAAISALWLAWRMMLDHPLPALICFWVALGVALGSGMCLFFTLGAVNRFRACVTTMSACSSHCSILKTVIGGCIPIVASLSLISLWGAHFTLSAYNLMAALVFVTTASVILIAPTVCYSALLSAHQMAEARFSSKEPRRKPIRGGKDYVERCMVGDKLDTRETGVATDWASKTS